MSDLSAYIFSQLDKELETLPTKKNEITQHLVELGYIPLYKTNALTAGDVKKGRQQFLSEVKNSGLFTDDQMKFLSVRGEEFMLSTLLRRITDIDEGIVLDALPEIGSFNLVTRMIHYRLDLFGLWPQDIALPFSMLSLQKLEEIAGFGLCTALQAANHVADLEQFTKHLLEIHPPENFILVFRSPKVKEETKRKLDRRQAFKRQVIEDFGERTDFVRQLAQDILKNKPEKVDFGFLNREATDPFKRFVMRLLQIHQWQDGFYNGLLDSDIGDVSLKGFLDTIDFYNESENQRIKTHRVITYVHRGFFIFNSLFFLQEYMVEDENGASEDLLVDSISGQLQDAGADDQSAFYANLQQLKFDIYKQSEEKPKERKGLLQRIYYGVKRLLKKAFRFVKKIFNWVKDKVEKAWGLLKGLFRNFFEDLQMGIRAFVDGINFIFGKKGIESNLENESIYSKFSIDGDSVSLTTSRISNVLKLHIQNVDHNINAMKFTLAIVAGILKLIINMVSIITWPLLLMNIIKIYKNISGAYQDLSAKAA
jgi:hypothetical protein